MSFTGIVKNELSKLELERLEAISELSSLIKNNSTIDSKKIRISTENSSVARHIFNLIKNLYSVYIKIIVRKGYNYQKNYIYILEINDRIDFIIEDLCLNKDIPDSYIIDDDILKRSYLRGVFLACGSINDPKKSRYHLEFIVDNYSYATFVSSLLNEYNLNSKVLKRDNRYMIYIKEAEKISDFIKLLNARTSLFYYEDIRIYRDHKNMTNRLNNCEQANVDKMIQASSEQLELIRKLRETRDFDLLEQGIKDICIYKEKYPESSMAELAEIISTETERPITKSGINHRFRKIKEMITKK